MTRSIAGVCAALCLAGCDAELFCDVGTLEVDGACVPADGASPAVDRCGAGTHYDLVTQECVPDEEPTRCGPNTVPQIDDDGVTVCVGTGGGGCDAPIACPSAAPGKFTVCGRLRDFETSETIVADGAEGALCDPNAPAADGPCALRVLPFDPLPFSTNPQGTPPLAHEEAVLDDCGRFRITDITRPFNGIVAIIAEDIEDTGAHRVSATGFQTSAGETRTGVRGHVVRAATDLAWTASAGDPFDGQTFAERGVYAPTYLHAGAPVEGVAITAGGVMRADDDFYFSDAGAERSTVDAEQQRTGPNGTGLLVDSSLLQHSGTGGEPDGCVWPSGVAGSVPGVVFYQDREARLASDPEETCP